MRDGVNTADWCMRCMSANRWNGKLVMTSLEHTTTSVWVRGENNEEHISVIKKGNVAYMDLVGHSSESIRSAHVAEIVCTGRGMMEE